MDRFTFLDRPGKMAASTRALVKMLIKAYTHVDRSKFSTVLKKIVATVIV
jgi:hypothetical protein